MIHIYLSIISPHFNNFNDDFKELFKLWNMDSKKTNDIQFINGIAFTEWLVYQTFIKLPLNEDIPELSKKI